MEETLRANDDCAHTNQKQRDGVWVCKLCDAVIPTEPKSAEDFRSVRFGGLANFKQFRDLGVSEQRATRKNIELFRQRKGYDPVREDGKDRWV